MLPFHLGCGGIGGEGGAFCFIKIILIGPGVLDRPVSWPPLLLELVERALMEFKTPTDPPRGAQVAVLRPVFP